MRNEEAETMAELADETLEVLRKAEACTAANGIIRSHLEPITGSPICKAFTVHSWKSCRKRESRGKRIALRRTCCF